MTSLYRSRESKVSSANTKTQLTTLGSESAPGPLLVPSNMKFLTGIIGCANSDSAAASNCVYLVRLEGPGLPNGPETFWIGASGGNVATGQQDAAQARVLNMHIPVTSGNEVLVFAEQAEGDTGTIDVGVTLRFSDA